MNTMVRRPAVRRLHLRGRHDVLDLLDPGHDRAELDEMRFRHLGDDARERGLARAWRTPEDDRVEHVTLDGLTQRSARRQDVILADDFVKGAGSDAIGKRGAGNCRGRVMALRTVSVLGRSRRAIVE